MSTKKQFNFYTMIGDTELDTEMLIASMWDDLELIIDSDGVVTDIAGNYVAVARYVGVGNGICC